MSTDPNKPGSFGDVEDADVGGLTLADLDPESERDETPPCQEGTRTEDRPAEGPDIG